MPAGEKVIGNNAKAGRSCCAEVWENGYSKMGIVKRAAICMVCVAAVVLMMVSSVFAAQDPVSDVFSTYTAGWDRLDVDYGKDSIFDIASRLQQNGWKFQTDYDKNHKNSSTWLNDVYVDFFGVPQFTAEYYDDRNTFVYGMHVLEWTSDISKLIEIDSTDNADTLTSYFTAAEMAVDGVLPEAFLDLLGKKTYEDLGFTPSYISALMNQADSVENDLIHLSNYGNGVDYVELYKSSDGQHFILTLYGGPYTLKLGSHNPNKIITYVSIEGIR